MAVEARLADLALEGARFVVHLESTDVGEHGREAVEFRVAANPGEPPKSLKRVASGGELSRISLALHLAARAELAATMVFDEVDAGVGGAAAQAVGRSLAELARSAGAQVVVVTHLPQVAAFADVHYRVLKSEDRGRSTATVARVDGGARIQELSRMMAGLPESERAREHAKELLELAAGTPS
jgi:DNA repair protein RecN (Recombination protein N)